jgi:microcystin-dependent protein
MGQEPFLGQLALVGFSFAPLGWATANGQILALSQNAALFSLLGTFYGGNGTSNFALPNLQGTVAIGQGQLSGGSDYIMGETGGTPLVTLNPATMPPHSHIPLGVSQKGDQSDPTGRALANGENSSGLPVDLYASGAPAVAMYNAAVAPVGSGQPHNNLMPFLTLNWIIAMQGVFPARG